MIQLVIKPLNLIIKLIINGKIFLWVIKKNYKTLSKNVINLEKFYGEDLGKQDSHNILQRKCILSAIGEAKKMR